MGHNKQMSYRAILLAWASFISLIFIILTLAFSTTIYQEKSQAEIRHNQFMSTSKTKSIKTPNTIELKSTIGELEPTKVQTGIYIERIHDFSIKKNHWLVDFYIWFNWQGSKVNPNENFQIVNGEILKKTKTHEDISGNNNFARYLVQASVSKFFDTALFPHDNHLLTLIIEDKDKKIDQLEFIADNKSSALSSRVKIPGYKIYQNKIVVKEHSYKTNKGSPTLDQSDFSTFSQVIYGIWIKQAGWGYYIKLNT